MENQAPKTPSKKGWAAGLLLNLALFLSPIVMAGTPPVVTATPGTVIHNVGVLTWDGLVGGGDQQPVNTLTTDLYTTVVGARTPSTATFLTYAPGASMQLAGPTACSVGGGAFNSLPAPVSASGRTLDPSQPQPLGAAPLYYPGDPVFVQLTDGDQNINPLLRETVLVTVSVVGTSQEVTLRLTETGPNTGVFVGYVFSSGGTSGHNACTLMVKANQHLSLHYTDASDATDSSSAQAVINPYNTTFDSTTGTPVDGARITLVDADTGAPVKVIGRDGVSEFPSTVVSGKSVTDSSGAVYSAAAGAYLLPQVPAGHYRLQVVPPTGYRFASTVTAANLQTLAGAPYVLGPASFGLPFTLTATAPVGFDIPLDPVAGMLFVQKTASTAVAAVGDMVQFTVTIQNSDKTHTAHGISLLDTLPQGFRYVAGSLRIGTSKTKVADPTISKNGQELLFPIEDLLASGQVGFTYVTEVTAATPLGTAINRAQGSIEGGMKSNVATAQVLIQNELMQDVNTLIGRVMVGCDKPGAGSPPGVGGIRVLMENGNYVVTDKDGRFHFEAVKNGTHVVQVDTDSLPKGYAMDDCERNTRFAGRSYSQFVELHGGALWRTNFHVRKLPPPAGKITVQVNQDKAADIRTVIDLKVEGVAVSKLSVTAILPAGLHYTAGSALLDGVKINDPSGDDSGWVFRLGDHPSGWAGALRFSASENRSKSGMDHAPLSTTVLANFSTAGEANQHTPPADVLLPDTGKSQPVTQQRLTVGAPWPDPSVKKTAGVSDESNSLDDQEHMPDVKAEEFVLGTQWQQETGDKPSFLWPKDGYLPSVPAIKVAIIHGPKQHVRLLVNGSEVSIRNFLGTKSNSKHTVTVSQWLGVPLVEGDNALTAEITEGGKVVREVKQNVHFSGPPVRAELVPEKTVLIADGKTRSHLAIRLFDRWGYLARPGMMGRYTLQSPYVAYESQKELQEQQLVATSPRQPNYIVGKEGLATIVLAPTTESGQVLLTIPLMDNAHQDLRAWMQPGKRDWILVGLATGTAAFNGIQGHIENVDHGDPNKDIFEGKRLAFYAKGMIKGKYLLTAAYDTAKTSSININGLQQSVDPNQYFMLYGDASEQGSDASSATKLYVKIERGQFYAMFGDFNTGLNVTELSRYDRRFNGLKSSYEGKKFGYTAFAARNAQSFVQDEIQGNGTSGLYRLSHQQILLNSESIRIETRDRYHSQDVLQTQTLSRYLDYTLDYFTGAVFFKQPVAAFDDNLNPVYIVAEYEVMRPGDQSITAGGRVAVKLANGRVELGATGVNEGSDKGSNKLGGVDVRIKLSTTTELKAEVAHSANNGDSGVSSLLTGYGGSAGSFLLSSTGKTSGSAYLMTLQNHGKKVESELYFRQLDSGFGLGQQSLGEGGMRKMGGNARYHLSKNWTLQGEAYSEDALVMASSRKAVDVGALYQANGRTLTVGVRHVSDQYQQPVLANGSTTPVPVVGTGVGYGLGPGTLGSGTADQLYLGGSSAILNGKVTLHGLTNQNVGGGTDPAYPPMTQVGADYKLTDKATLFLNQQFIGGENVQYSSMTELGVRATAWKGAQVTQSLGQQMTEYGPRIFATSGLTQGWQVNPTLSLSAGFNQVKSLRKPNVSSNSLGLGNGGTGSVGADVTPGDGGAVINPAVSPLGNLATQDFTSGFVGAAWHKNDWSWTTRVESLKSDTENRIGLFGGFYRDLSNGNALASSLQAFDSSFVNLGSGTGITPSTGSGGSTNVTLRFSFAHRPDDARWSLLEQLDLNYINQQGLAGFSPFLQQGSTGIAATQQSPQQLAAAQGTNSTFGINQQSSKLVNNLQLNYRGDRSQWSIYYGSKLARYVFDSGTYSGYTDLIGSEYRYDLSDTWDVGVVANRMHSWRSGVSSTSLGLETGWSMGTNMWLSVGYNFKGFYDQDFTAAHYTAKGVFIRFRFKFDQDTVKAMAEGMQR